MGSVYLLTDGEYKYYGSTIMKLNRRLTTHKSPSNNCSSKIMNKDKLKIIEVECVEDKDDLKHRERWWINHNKCVNKQNPISTSEEKAELHRKRSKKYYEANKQKCYEAKNKCRTKPYQCPCGSLINIGNKSDHEKSKKHIAFIKI